MGTPLGSRAAICKFRPLIQSEITGYIGRITLNRPEAHNALTIAAMTEIREVLEGWTTQDIRAVIITGTGKSFCSGVAFEALAETDWSKNPLTDLCNAVENFRAPTICALNGGVFGGGVELAIACDFRVGVAGMKMFVPAAKIGIHYTSDGIARVVQKLGAQMARRIFLLAEKFDDNQLLECGFLDRLGLDEADTLANTLSGLAPTAVQGMRRTILEISRGALDKQAAEKQSVKSHLSAEHAEGMAAMKEKRRPNFTSPEDL